MFVLSCVHSFQWFFLCIVLQLKEVQQSCSGCSTWSRMTQLIMPGQLKASSLFCISLHVVQMCIQFCLTTLSIYIYMKQQCSNCHLLVCFLIRHKILSMLCKNPPFTKTTDSPLCNEALVDQLWKLMNSGETHAHTQASCCH